MNKLLLAIVMLFQTGIYTIHFTNNAGNDTTLAPHSGKKILLVPIASGSTRVSQLAGLQQLYTQYHDSLAIVVFPSNSFGHEPLNDAGIKALCENTYHVTFDIAAKVPVTGDTAGPIFKWLADQTQNGTMSAVPLGDFHKFLIDKDGTLIGTFSPSIQLTDSSFIATITSN